jgi:hypothetical protein
MANTYIATELFATVRNGLREIGYRDDLLRANYSFADVFTPSYSVTAIELAAFAQDPPSYRNACFGITMPRDEGPAAIRRYQALGAPQILALHPEAQEIRRWKMIANGDPELLERVKPAHLRALLRDRQREWGPEGVLRAKTIGLSRNPVQLDFFDMGLIPALEEIVQEKLDDLLGAVIASCKELYQRSHNQEPNYGGLFRLIFRLIAAKLLADRQYLGDWANSDVQKIIKDVETFYFRSAPAEPILADIEVQELAWDRIRKAFHFQNLSVEALAYVYENTLVSSETRRALDTHATPPEIAEYLVHRLPFEELPQEERRVFEPFAGHAPFLIAALGRLRTLLPSSIDRTHRHEYLVRMLSGMEIDSFAREVARYSLILADYPNPDGWRISGENAFTSPEFNRYLEQSKVVLCNPPFGDFTAAERRTPLSIQSANRAVGALRRVLQHPPAMLGFVLPRVFVNGQSYREARQQIASLYKEIEVTVLPDVAFEHSEAETVLLVAHGMRTNGSVCRSAWVKRSEYDRFVRTGNPTWRTEVPIPRKSHLADPELWHTPLHLVWDQLAYLPRLGDLTEIHRGIEYNISLKTNAHLLISGRPKTGFIPGLAGVSRDFEPYSVVSFEYLNVSRELMRTDAYRRPWGSPKVIANAARLSRGPWTIAAAIDDQGLVCSQRFHGIWPTRDLSLELIAAIVNSPVANAFISIDRTSRDNQVRKVRQIPVPVLTPAQTESIASLVREYRLYRSRLLIQSESSQPIEEVCREIILQIDAELLAAYSLPAQLERELLVYFSEHGRPRPAWLDVQYPAGFSSQTRTQGIARPEQIQERRIGRYQELVDKKYVSALTEAEHFELHWLGEEIDGFYDSFYEPILEDLQAQLKKRQSST